MRILFSTSKLVLSKVTTINGCFPKIMCILAYMDLRRVIQIRLYYCYLKKQVCLLVGIEPKDTTKAKSGRRKDLLLAARKENTGGLSQSIVSPNGKIGEI